MPTVSFKTGSVQCYDCVMALKKFVGSLEGISSIEMDGENKIDISYDSASMTEDKLTRIVNDTVDRLGFRVEKTL